MIRTSTLFTLILGLGLSHTSATAQRSSVASLTPGSTRLQTIASLSPRSIDIETAILTAGEMPILKAQPWQQSAPLIIGHIPHDKLTAMKARTEALISVLHDCFTSGEGDPTWHGEYFAGKFGAQCTFFSHDDKKAQLLLLANDLSPLLGHYSINGTDYLTIGAKISRRNGCVYFEGPDAGNGDEQQTSGQLQTSFWLITADSTQLPYIPVTRREYLLEVRKQLISDTNYIAIEWRGKISIRPASLQEAEKQSELRQLKSLYSGADLEARTNIYLRNYITDEVYLQQRIEVATRLQRNTLRFVDSLLHAAPRELQRPAYLSDQTVAAGRPRATAAAIAAGFLFPGFADNQPHPTLLVRRNPAASDHSLGEDKPQFVLLGWRCDPEYALTAGLDRQLRENLDAGEIQKMLRK